MKVQMIMANNKTEWRAWLEQNHATEKEVWLIFYKKHTGVPCVSYEEAVEEAICFGWIDNIIKRIDEKRYSQKFTPRKRKSNWSELNKKRVRKLIEEGRMTEAGMVSIEGLNLSEMQDSKISAHKFPEEFPENLKIIILTNKKAWRNFNKLSPSKKRLYVGWITSAKKDETQLKRLNEAIRLLAQGKELGMK